MKKLSLLFLMICAAPSFAQTVPIPALQEALGALITKCNERHQSSNDDAARKQLHENCSQEAQKLVLSGQIKDWIGTVTGKSDPGWGSTSQTIMVETAAGIQLGAVFNPPRPEIEKLEQDDVVSVSGPLWSSAPPTVEYWPYEGKLFVRLSAAAVVVRAAR